MTSLGAVRRLRAMPQGLQRIDAGRDLRAVIDLLEIGFRDELEARDRRWLAELASISSAGPARRWLLGRAPFPGSGFDGFVWYAEGRLVANLSLMRCSPDVWVIANVVTHPSFRRHGIAADLLIAALDALRRRGATQVQLQVRIDNAPAHALYERFGFWRMNAATTMRLTSAASGTRFAPPSRAGMISRIDASQEADRVRRLLSRSGEFDRGGPAGHVVQAAEHHWLWDGIEDWFHGRSRHTLAAIGEGEYRGLLCAVALSRHGPHRIDLIVDPRWHGRVEAGLIDRGLAVLARCQPFAVEAEVDTRRENVMRSLEAAGFREIRSLDRLAFDLDARGGSARRVRDAERPLPPAR